MTKEVEKPLLLSPSAISRRQLLKLAATGAIAGAGLIAESKLAFLNSLAWARLLDEESSEEERTSSEMLSLRDHLAAEIENYSGQTAISVTNILTGETIDLNGNRPQLPGCVANLPCALTAIAKLSAGTASYTKEQIEPAMTTMVRYSNPTAGLRVVETIGERSVAAGVATINYLMKLWGMERSFYDHPPAYESSYSVQGDSNWLVANEINKVLARMARNQLFPYKEFNWNLYALWVMADNKPGLNFIIPGEIPETEAIVVHKVGWFPGLPHSINDAGVVAAKDHRFAYVITFMHQNADFAISEKALFYGPGFFGRKLSKIVYESFLARYGQPQSLAQPKRPSLEKVAVGFKMPRQI